MKRGMFVLSLILCGELIGCVHTHSVHVAEPKSEIPAGFRVGIGSSEIREGDRVAVLKPNCKKVASGGRDAPRDFCVNKKIGEALVLKVLDHDSSIVAPQEGLKMDETMKVEKQ
jgi:hypothetical protein